MKLNSKSKHDLKQGDFLKNDCFTFYVELIEKCGNCIYITVIDIKDNRRIYFQPISGYYGMDIISQ